MKSEKCLICGEPLSSGRHLRKHGISKEMYLRMYAESNLGICPDCGRERKYVNGRLSSCKCKKKFVYYLIAGNDRFLALKEYKSFIPCKIDYITSVAPYKFMITYPTKNLAEILGMNRVIGCSDGYVEGTKVEDVLKNIHSILYKSLYVYQEGELIHVSESILKDADNILIQMPIYELDYWMKRHGFTKIGEFHFITDDISYYNKLKYYEF